jgi:hypothetical protein
MSKTSRLAVTAALALLAFGALAGPAVAEERKVDETRKVKADARVRIENVAGEIIVRGWGKKEIHVQGTLGEDVERLDIEGDESSMKIEVVYPRRMRGRTDGAYLEIDVPEGAEVEIGVVSADVEASKLKHMLEVGAVSGEVRVEGTFEELTIETVSGDIDVTAKARRASFESVSGDLDLDGLDTEELDVETVSGDLVLEGSDLQSFEFSSVSGELEFEGTIAKSGTFSTQSGDIELVFTGKVDAEFDISTFSGDIDNSFGPRSRRTSRWTGSERLSFTEGDGKALIEIETFSGSVRLDKR